MKILSITTSSPICAVSILEDRLLIKEICLNSGLTHSETLMPMIQKILKETNLTLNNIDLLACDIGPGSFTGIRIGISTLKAFADSLAIPTIGVSSLEALSYGITGSNTICSLLDAKKNHVYYEIFENTNQNPIIQQEPCFGNIDQLLSKLKELKLKDPITFVGDGSISYQEKILEYLPHSKFASTHELSATNIGIIGFNHYQKGMISPLEPLYLRKSEAEKKWEEKQNGTI